MLFLGLSVPGEVPRCSASVLVLLAGFLNSEPIVILKICLNFWLSLNFGIFKKYF